MVNDLGYETQTQDFACYSEPFYTFNTNQWGYIEVHRCKLKGCLHIDFKLKDGDWIVPIDPDILRAALRALPEGEVAMADHLQSGIDWMAGLP